MCRRAAAASGNPGKLEQVAYGLLPRDVFIAVSSGRLGTSTLPRGKFCGRVIDLIQVNARSCPQ